MPRLRPGATESGQQLFDSFHIQAGAAWEEYLRYYLPAAVFDLISLFWKWERHEVPYQNTPTCRIAHDIIARGTFPRPRVSCTSL